MQPMLAWRQKLVCGSKKCWLLLTIFGGLIGVAGISVIAWVSQQDCCDDEGQYTCDSNTETREFCTEVLGGDMCCSEARIILISSGGATLFGIFLFAIFSCGVCVCCCYEKKRSAANYWTGDETASRQSGITGAAAAMRDSNLELPPPPPISSSPDKQYATEPVRMSTGYHSPAVGVRSTDM